MAPFVLSPIVLLKDHHSCLHLFLTPATGYCGCCAGGFTHWYTHLLRDITIPLVCHTLLLLLQARNCKPLSERNMKLLCRIVRARTPVCNIAMPICIDICYEHVLLVNAMIWTNPLSSQCSLTCYFRDRNLCRLKSC